MALSSFHSLRALRYLSQSFTQFNFKLTFITFGLIFLKSVSSGLSFLMILPLLEYVGVSHQANESHAFSLVTLFTYLHIPQTLLTILGFFTLMMCFTAAIAYQEQLKSTQLQQTYNQYLRTLLHRLILFSNWSFLSRQKKSDLVYMMITETQNIAFCNHQFLTLLNQLLLMAVHTGMALYLSWSMTLIAMITALILLVFMLPIQRLTSKAGWAHLHANQTLQQVITEQLGALKLIKGSGLEIHSSEQFEVAGLKLMQQQFEHQGALARNRWLYASFSAIFFSVLLYAAIELLAIPMTQLFMLLIIYARILPMVSSSQQIYQHILHKIPAYEHIKKMMREAQQQQDEVDSAKIIQFNHMINLQEVTFHYSSTSESIFRQLNVQLLKNTTTLLQGISGAGKTTLVDLVAGLLMPNKGTVFVDHIPLTQKNSHAWRQQIAYMTQDVFLFNASIRENLQWVNQQATEEDMLRVLKLVAAEFVLHLEGGLDTEIGDNGVLLSGGERQRLGLARAILQNPTLLILDESTNALDNQRIAHIHQSLANLKGQMTILIISHQEIPADLIDQAIQVGVSQHVQVFA